MNFNASIFLFIVVVRVMMRRRHVKLQSAMEYLMTYGWAILIIAVVLGALFALGVFNVAGPRAQAGSCQVFRPYGPGTTAGLSLEGQCNGRLPQYVGVFDNPLTSGGYPACPCKYVTINSGGGFPVGTSPRSMFAWVYINSNFATDTDAECAGANWANCWYTVADMGGGNGCYSNFFLITYGVNGNGLGVGLDSSCDAQESSLIITPDTWHFIGVTYGSAGANTVTFYLDGTSNVLSGFTINTVEKDPGAIGSNFGVSGGFPGSIANVQYYNTTLTQSEVTALYQEGIGGAPVVPQNLVGWWPLNGDAKDYSGNNNGGATSGISFTSQWTNGYKAP